MPSYDILQGVKYDPRYDDQNFALIAQGVEEANKRYNIGEASIGDALAQYGSIPAVNPDRPILAKRLENFNKDIDELVNKKYAGDYGAASKEIARRIKTEQPMFAAAKQRYEMDQKMMPLYTQLESQKKLINKDGIDPRTLSTFDAQGNINMPTYSPIERPEYGDVVYNDIGKAIDQMVTEGKLKQAEVPWLMTNIQNRGLAAISNPELKKRIEGYVTEFEGKTPFGIDPLMQQQYKGNTKQFIEDTLRSRVSSGTQRGYQEDFDYKQQIEEDEYNRRKGLDQPTGPKLSRLYSTSVIGEKEDLSNVPLTDITFKGQMKKDIIKSRWKDEKGNINPSAFAGALAKFKEAPWGSRSTGVEPYSLSSAIVKDQMGQTDVDATLANIEKLAAQPHTASIGKIPSKDAAIAFLKEMNNFTKNKIAQKFGDYGVDVMGFDLTDKNSAQTYTQMGDYINQVSPDVFNFETGKFSDIKTSKLSKNKEFLEARKDNKFKINGVIKGADGDIKFIAEDGSGEPQVVSSNNDDVNRNLLRMFGSPDLIANFEYKNFKLTPSGNAVIYKDVNSNDEKKYKLKSGYKVERTSGGKYNLKNSEGKVFKENGVPKEFDKWEVIHNIGLEEEK